MRQVVYTSLLLIIVLRFTCGEREICLAIKNSEIIMNMIVDVVMPIYNQIEYSDNYAKTSSGLWQYRKDDLNNSVTDSKICLMLTWSTKCVITGSTGPGIFARTDTKLYVPVVTLSTEDNTKLLEQLKSGFKRTIN